MQAMASKTDDNPVLDDLARLLAPAQLHLQPCADGTPTVWVEASDICAVMRTVKPDYPMLHDLFAIDERQRQHRPDQPDADFSVVYQLLSFKRNADLRIKVALHGEYPSLPTIVAVFPVANWYEREAWDMFGIEFDGHPNLRRILLPPTWKGHALRKEHPARATEMDPYSLSEEQLELEQEALRAQ